MDIFFTKTKKTLTPSEFIKIPADERRQLHIAIVPPKLGSKHFGYFVVKSDEPYYQFEDERKNESEFTAEATAC